MKTAPLIHRIAKPSRWGWGRIEPMSIELADDGLRVYRQGQVRGFPMVCLHNPGLIASIAAEKAIRRTIRAANERAYT